MQDSGLRKTFCGTQDYMAPEMQKDLPYDHRVDVWALGILLYEMTQGHAPFPKGVLKELNSQKELDNVLIWSNEISENCKDLIKNILKFNIE